MGSLGWHNPFPLEVGGGETVIESIYYAMRSAAGKGAAAADEDYSIEALWRQCRARAFGNVATFGERSTLQAFPDRATDALPYYEQLFRLANDPEGSDQARREAAATRYTLQIASAIPDIALALSELDERFEVLSQPDANAAVTLFGRAFEDYVPEETYGGGRKSTLLPNYATQFTLYVLLELGGGVLPGAAEAIAIQAATELLHEVLPGHNSFQIVTHHGFTLDVDLLDLTSLEA
jgi:hypothetical protein